MPQQLLRFAGVGAIATLVHVCVALLANMVLGIEDMLANFAGFGAAVTLSYFGHALFSFQTQPDHVQHLPRFLFVSLIGLFSSSSLVWLISQRLGQGFGLAMALVAVAVPLATFLAMKFWVFTSHRHRIRLDWASVLIAIVFAIVFLAIYWSRPHHHDVAWYLVATQKMLEGAVLYVDVIELNPPLNFYLTVPAIMLSEALNLSLVNGQYVFVAILTAGSIVWSGHILRDEGLLTPPYRATFLVLMAFGVTLSAFNSIAQRDHLLVILLLPWLIGQLSTAAGPGPIMRSAVAAIGICLKPHFLIFPILMLGRDMWRNRSLRPLIWPEYLSMLAIGVSYATFVAIVHPLYFSEIIPTAQFVYGVYGDEFVDVIYSIRSLIGIALLLSLVSVLRPTQGSGVFVLAILGGLMSYLAQGKGFLYHLVPLISFVILGGFWVAVSIQAQRSTRLLSFFASAMMCSLVMALPFYGSDLKDEVVMVARDLGVTQSILTASPSLDAGPAAALDLGTVWASRYPAQWIYPGGLEYRARTDCAKDPDICKSIDQLLNRNREHMMADLLHFEPELIAVAKETPIRVSQFRRWTDFMEPHPKFGSFMSQYRLVKTTAHYEFYLHLGPR